MVDKEEGKQEYDHSYHYRDTRYFMCDQLHHSQPIRELHNTKIELEKLSQFRLRSLLNKASRQMGLQTD